MPKKSLREFIQEQLPPTALALIPVGIALNLGIGTIVQLAKLPVFIDSVGTVLVAALAGPVAPAGRCDAYPGRRVGVR